MKKRIITMIMFILLLVSISACASKEPTLSQMIINAQKVTDNKEHVHIDFNINLELVESGYESTYDILMDFYVDYINQEGKELMLTDLSMVMEDLVFSYSIYRGDNKVFIDENGVKSIELIDKASSETNNGTINEEFLGSASDDIKSLDKYFKLDKSNGNYVYRSKDKQLIKLIREMYKKREAYTDVSEDIDFLAILDSQLIKLSGEVELVFDENYLFKEGIIDFKMNVPGSLVDGDNMTKVKMEIVANYPNEQQITLPNEEEWKTINKEVDDSFFDIKEGSVIMRCDVDGLSKLIIEPTDNNMVDAVTMIGGIGFEELGLDGYNNEDVERMYPVVDEMIKQMIGEIGYIKTELDIENRQVILYLKTKISEMTEEGMEWYGFDNTEAKLMQLMSMELFTEIYKAEGCEIEQ